MQQQTLEQLFLSNASPQRRAISARQSKQVRVLLTLLEGACVMSFAVRAQEQKREEKRGEEKKVEEAEARELAEAWRRQVLNVEHQGASRRGGSLALLARSFSSPFTFTIPPSKPATTRTTTLEKKTITAQEGSSSGKDIEPTVKVAIKPPTPQEYSHEEAKLIRRWGLIVLEEASRLPTDEKLIKQAANNFNKKTNTAIINNKPIQITPAIIEHIFNTPNAHVPKPCTEEQISWHLKENPEKKLKRKVGGQGIATNDLPKQKAYKFAVEAIGLKNCNTYISEKLLGILLAREFKPEAPINLVQFLISSVASQSDKYPHMQLYKARYIWQYIYQHLLEGSTDLLGPKRPKVLIKPPVPPVTDIVPLTKLISVDILDSPVRPPRFNITDVQTEEVESTRLIVKRDKLQQLQKDSVKVKFVMDNQISPTLTYNAPTSKFILDNETFQSLNDSGVLAIQTGWNTIVNDLEDKAKTFTQALVNEAVVSYLGDLDNISDEEGDDDGEDKADEDHEDPAGISGHQGGDDDHDDADQPGTGPSRGTSTDPPPPSTSLTDPPASKGTDDHPQGTGAAGGQQDTTALVTYKKRNAALVPSTSKEMAISTMVSSTGAEMAKSTAMVSSSKGKEKATIGSIDSFNDANPWLHKEFHLAKQLAKQEVDPISRACVSFSVASVEEANYILVITSIWLWQELRITHNGHMPRCSIMKRYFLSISNFRTETRKLIASLGLRAFTSHMQK
ncbi:hypothetical protein L7F22_029198 [Adiantum nelumboides]|nr:hypothetical protein [Adiantum nelumboides]